MKSRIFYLTQHFFPENQAAAFRATESALLLQEEGFEVVLITGFPNLVAERKKGKYRGRLLVRENYKGLEVVRLYTPLDTKKGAFVRLLNYCSFMILAVGVGLFMKKPTTVYASSPPFFVALAGLILATMKRARFVPEIRDLWIDFAVLLGQLKNNSVIAVMRVLEKIIYRAADRIVVVTEGYRDHLVGLGVKEAKIRVIHAGVDFDQLIKGNGEKVRAELNLTNHFIVGYAGNVGLAQGLEVMVRAANLMRDEQNLAFIVVGDGADHRRLTEVAKYLKLNNIYSRGQVTREEAADYMSAFNCCLVLLINDPLFNLTLPSKLFECLANSRPVLLGLGGEAEEIIRRSESGLIFNVQDPASLVQQIRYLKDNQMMAIAMGENGRRYVNEKFERRKLVNKLGVIFKELGSGAGVR